MVQKSLSPHTDESRSAKRSDAPPHRSRQPSPADGRRRQDGWRETVESIVIAFVLAFLFRAFEAEAFVIPTGSMAPTLRGRNKEAICDECGYHFDIGASSEVDDDEYLRANDRISTLYCPNCRYQMPTTPSNPADEVRNLPVFKGDRILVNKFPYEFGDPQRWDVVVFKYPEEPKTNYIKRLVGLPNETLEIRQGDVYALRDGKLSILRKDPYKQKAIQLPVYDNDHPPRKLLENGWPECWAAVRRDDAPGNIAGWSDDPTGWIADPQARTFRLGVDQTGDGHSRWIRFRHFVPNQDVWQAVSNGNRPTAPKPVLITDFCGYNASGPVPELVDFGVYWVRDLTVKCRVDVTETNEQSELLLELNAGVRRYRCRINLSSGEATLSRNVAMAGDAKNANGSGEVEEKILATAETSLQGPGSYRVTFANVDNRICLWIDGHLADFGERAEYIPYGGLLVRQQPQDADLIPIGIAARRAVLTVSHLLVQRDMYYRSEFLRPGETDDASGEVIHEYDFISPSDDSFRRWQAKLSNPAAWYEDYITNLSANKIGRGEKYEHVSFRFVLGPDEFFMMGDNSPRSKDSRLWGNHRGARHRYAVPRSALVGKAFYVYWPHGVPFLNGGRGYPDGPQSLLNHGMMRRLFYHQVVQRNQEGRPLKIGINDNYPAMRIPFYPDVTRMRRIR